MSAVQVGEGTTTSKKQILGAKIFRDQRHIKKVEEIRRGGEGEGRDRKETQTRG